MSDYLGFAINPKTKEIEQAQFCDDYYGSHRYGVKFGDGLVYPQEDITVPDDKDIPKRLKKTVLVFPDAITEVENVKTETMEQREIKFRLRYSKTKKVVGYCEIWGGQLHYSTDNVSWGLEPIDLKSIRKRAGQIDWEQFTGLKDKYGVEIFEGDIVGREGVYHFIDRSDWKPSAGNWKIIGNKTKDFTGKGREDYISGYELFLVEWEVSSCGFEPFSDSKENCGHCGGGYNPKDFEVIGNVWEHPHLVEERNDIEDTETN